MKAAIINNIKKNDPSPIPAIYSKDLSSLINSMLEKDPKKRPSA